MPSSSTPRLSDAGGNAGGNPGDAVDAAVDHLLDVVKPRLRGWLHAVMFPIVVLGGIALVAATPTPRGRIGMSVFVVTAALLFGTSALYHRGTWTPPVARVLRRLDHANIFLVIAGTYTAFAATLLDDAAAATLLWVMWVGAVLGVVFKVAWVGAPRWVSTPLYVLLGWVAVFYVGPFYRSGGALVLALIVAGGVLYTLGAVVYGLKRPDPSPRWFGFHEVFHTFTILAFLAHFAAAGLAVATAGPPVGA